MPADGRRHVLLLHGTCGTAFDGTPHCPFTAEDVRRAGFDVCLAGHLHAGGVRDGVVVYPGSPEPLTWSENGRHSTAIVDLPEAGEPRIELVDVNAGRYAVVRVDVSGATSSADVEREAVDAVRKLGDPRGLHVRVGRVEPGCEPCHPGVREALCAAGPASVELRDNTRPAFDLDALSRGNGARAIFVTRMRGRVAAGDDASELALELGLRALEGEAL